MRSFAQRDRNVSLQDYFGLSRHDVFDQVTDNPGTSVQPSWLAEDNSSSWERMMIAEMVTIVAQPEARIKLHEVRFIVLLDQPAQQNDLLLL